MNEIHQIYCTHCTHGTSALERREGEGWPRRMLGYSARRARSKRRPCGGITGSWSADIYYYLPGDTPAEEKLLLTADTAPRRLVYLPAAGGLRLLRGQVCYRPIRHGRSTRLVFRPCALRRPPRGVGLGPPRDCLRLWRVRGWVEEDSPHLPFLLPTLSGIDEVLEGPPRCHRRPHAAGVFSRRRPADSYFDDPAQVIPPRWRGQGPARTAGAGVRAAVLDGACWKATGPGGQSLLLIVEPELATLLFYARAASAARPAMGRGDQFFHLRAQS